MKDGRVWQSVKVAAHRDSLCSVPSLEEKPDKGETKYSLYNDEGGEQHDSH